MKAVVVALWLSLLLPVACSQLPELRQVGGAWPSPADSCDHVFPQGDWQFLHALEATPPTGNKQTLLGLSQLSSTRKTGTFVIMTIEGMVLFEAHVGDGIDIKRAVPPFDRPGMAQGIVDDLRLIFFAPDPSTRITGALDNGNRVCRFALPDGGTQDIEVHGDAGWTIYQYNRSNRITRSVQPVSVWGRSVHGMPNQILLDAPGPAGYRLIITLLEAEPLTRSLLP